MYCVVCAESVLVGIDLNGCIPDGTVCYGVVLAEIVIDEADSFQIHVDGKWL